MPRNVRNVWVDVDHNGIKKSLATGPISKQDGMTLKYYQNCRGEVHNIFNVVTEARENDAGVIVIDTQIHDSSGKCIFQFASARK